MAHRIIWRPSARHDLFDLYDWIATEADADTAYSYTSRIESRCALLGDYPRQGAPRDDLGEGIRTLTFERRVVIAYRVGEAVEILRIFSNLRDSGQITFDA